MENPVQEKVQKCFESRLKAETELKKVQNDIVDAVDISERRASVMRLVESCNAAMTKAFAKNDKIWSWQRSQTTRQLQPQTSRNG